MLILAWAAVAAPLVLPPTEDARLWMAPASLAGLEIGSEDQGAAAWIVVTPAGWVLRVRSAGGAETSVPIAAPVNAAGREDAVWLAASLLHDLDLSRAPAPRSERVPATPRVAPVPVVDQDPLPSTMEIALAADETPTVAAPTVAQPSPVPPAPPEPVTITDVSDGTREAYATPPRPPRGWVRVGAQGAARSGLAVGGGAAIDAGVRVGATWVGAGVRGCLPRALPSVDGAGLSAVQVRAGAWWSPPRTVAPVLGATGELAFRSWTRGGDAVVSYLTPGVSLDLGTAWSLSPTLSVVPLARLNADLATTLIHHGDGAGVPLSPVEIELSIGARVLLP